MLLNIMRTGRRTGQEWGAAMIARALTSSALRRSVARAGGCEALLALVSVPPTADSDTVMLNAMHALLNLSTEPMNQVLLVC